MGTVPETVGEEDRVHTCTRRVSPHLVREFGKILLPPFAPVSSLSVGFLQQCMSGLAAAPAAARLRVSLRFVPQEGGITQYNLSLSTSSTRTAASKYGGALCRAVAKSRTKVLLTQNRRPNTEPSTHTQLRHGDGARAQVRGHACLQCIAPFCRKQVLKRVSGIIDCEPISSTAWWSM